MSKFSCSGYTLTPFDISTVIDRYEKGESIRSIASRYGSGSNYRSMISKVLKFHGVVVHMWHNMNGVAKITNDDAVSYASGETAISIALRIKTDSSVVLRQLQAMGVKTRGIREAMILSQSMKRAEG